MKEPENPFKFRSAETIESRLTFLKLFGHAIFKILPNDCLLNKVTMFRSSPGGGKTSLFRIFMPESLTEIFRSRTTYRELFYPLKKLGIIENNGPILLGVYLRLYDYASIQDSDVNLKQSNQYLFSLIGIRLIMKTLTGIIKLNGLEMEDLQRITVKKPQDHCITGLSLPCDGQILYEWASKMERNICGTINRFDMQNEHHPDNLSRMIDYLQVICPDNILFDGRPAISKVLVLLDDLHELTWDQRKMFLDNIIAARAPIPIWIAERLEALDIDEQTQDNGREASIVNIEKYWDNSGTEFEKFAKTISDKRTSHAPMGVTIDLHHHLENSVFNKDRDLILRNISDKIEKRIRTATRNTSLYNNWINQQDADKAAYERAISWRMLEIEIERAKGQTRIIDIPLEVRREESNSKLKATAAFLIHKEFKIPYYFGFPVVAKLATFNIEIFLRIAAALFDEMLSQRIQDPDHEILNAYRQEKIIKTIAQNYFDQISRLKNGTDVVTFLSAFNQFANEQNKQPNAPYPPGVTGIGISKSEYNYIIEISKNTNNRQNKKYKRLVEVFRTCIGHNHMSIKPDHNQGKPGNKVVVLYLNRLLCAHFDLPMGRGGWRPKTPAELAKWLDPPATRRIRGKTQS